MAHRIPPHGPRPYQGDDRAWAGRRRQPRPSPRRPGAGLMIATGGQAVVLSESAANRIRGATAPWGALKLTFSEADQMIGVLGAGERDGSMYDTSRAELAGHV